jgi:hypothetical protein
MITFYSVATGLPSSYATFSIHFNGDGATSKIEVDFKEAPFSFRFHGKTPVGVVEVHTLPANQYQDEFQLKVDGTKVRFMFNTPIPVDTQAAIEFTYLWN